MGSCYISINQNGFNLSKAYQLLKKFEIVEASEMAYFNALPPLSKVMDINLGVDGTENSFLKLKNGGFCVVDGTFNVKEGGL